MARLTTPLTNTEVKQAKPKDKEYSLSDGNGLALRVKPNGSKLWLFNYTPPFKKNRTNISFGSYPDISLADARKKSAEARRLLKSDIDPKQHWNEQRQQTTQAYNNTFKAVAELWIEVKQKNVSKGHAKDIFRSLELHAFPSFGDTPIHLLKAPITIQALKPLEAKGSLDTVKRMCQRINEVMYFAVNSGLIEANPLAKISAIFEPPKKQHYPTIKPDELPKFLHDLANANIKRTTRCLIEWQLHTMIRPNEAAGARWDEIDFDNRIWTIPAIRMKKKLEHKVPLSDQCLALLETMKPISQYSEYIFPSDRNSKKPTNSSTANVAIKRMGYGGLLVSHGLRALASTTLNEQGFDFDVVESALAHIEKNEVRRAYNRAEYIERRRKLMEWWSQHIEQAAMGNLSMASGHKMLRSV
ncbi:Integrase [Oceanospirillum multiglobuliferum]|uniref:Integrase n=2 Tax=Oceanospirillum TaxID=965 RepID=A0A1T4RGI2_9GAMM|nr:integrase domain-containing protein [Oceanospirillum multiglobuliferum]OPX54873.1 integrase [Oceanospirillum multiglobuliferum]SKA15053.1 Integrase [Oceanospirillum multiglobuliferum]